MDIRSENDKKSGYEVQMEAEERVIVFAVASGGVSVEDTEKSLDELEELLETAGAATVGRLSRVWIVQQVIYILAVVR